MKARTKRGAVGASVQPETRPATPATRWLLVCARCEQTYVVTGKEILAGTWLTCPYCAVGADPLGEESSATPAQ